jgi:hypothetical protein
MYEVNAFMELNIRCHNGTERHDAADGRDVNAAANILNNESRTTDRGMVLQLVAWAAD